VSHHHHLVLEVEGVLGEQVVLLLLGEGVLLGERVGQGELEGQGVLLEQREQQVHLL